MTSLLADVLNEFRGRLHNFRGEFVTQSLLDVDVILLGEDPIDIVEVLGILVDLVCRERLPGFGGLAVATLVGLHCCQ